MAEFIKVPSYSLAPDKLTLFERLEWSGFSDRQRTSFENLKNNQSKYNDISDAGRKRLLNAVSYLLYLAKNKDIIGTGKNFKLISDNEILIEKTQAYKNFVKYKLTFITLTLSASQKHDDKDITAKLLNSFLNAMRRKWNVERYVWKAEKQENGNIHYHILTDKFIYWREIRDVWNKLQESLGYVKRYSENMKEYFKDGFRMSDNPKDKRTRAKQYKAYIEGLNCGFTDPNSTDIHALYKVKNIPAYIAKYISKPITKTERTNTIDNLMNEIEFLKESVNELRIKIEQTSELSKQHINLLQLVHEALTEIENKEKQLNELKKKGVTGRIWGQSQTLSKIKNFTDVENFRDIPDIEIVDKTCRYKHFIDLGNENRVITYFFDINKTPRLKEILNNHISKSLNDGPDLFSNMNFSDAYNNFSNA
jgi:hypothetical protein